MVKYLGIVEGNVGCLTRKMAIPNKSMDKIPVGVQSKTGLKPYQINYTRQIQAPILRNKYSTARGNTEV